MKTARCSVPLLFLLLVPLAASAEDYFLSPSGDDQGPGTRQRPWQTIRKANETLQPGDTAVFLDGRYAGVIEPRVSGREEAPITYRSAAPEGAILSGGKSSGATYCRGESLACAW